MKPNQLPPTTRINPLACIDVVASDVKKAHTLKEAYGVKETLPTKRLCLLVACVIILGLASSVVVESQVHTKFPDNYPYLSDREVQALIAASDEELELLLLEVDDILTRHKQRLEAEQALLMLQAVGLEPSEDWLEHLSLDVEL